MFKVHIYQYLETKTELKLFIHCKPTFIRDDYTSQYSRHKLVRINYFSQSCLIHTCFVTIYTNTARTGWRREIFATTGLLWTSQIFLVSISKVGLQDLNTWVLIITYMYLMTVLLNGYKYIILSCHCLRRDLLTLLYW